MTHCITDTWSCQLPVSPTCGVANSPCHRYAESPTLCNTDAGELSAPLITDAGVTITVTDVSNSRDISTESRWLTISPTRGVVNYLYHRNTDFWRRNTKTGSCRLPVLPMWGVRDSLYHLCRESTTIWITNMVSFLFKNLITNSVHQWYEESATPRMANAGNWWLPISLMICEVATLWLMDAGSRFSIKNISANSKLKSERLEWLYKKNMLNQFI